MEEQISMDEAFISKLNDILEKNFHNEHFGVNELATSAGVSRSKLHRKLNEIKGQTASEFIKRFRLHKAYGLLKNNVSPVSEIAYAVGFKSPSYFSKCFHERYKCSPGEIKNKQQEPKENDFLKTLKSGVKPLFSRAVLILIGVLAVVILSYVFVSVSGGSSTKSEIVVLGVLPFKNLSDDPSNQYFADGVMEVILNHLSGVEGINVLSRTTMDQYRETDKTIPEIARELNITHVMEASIQRDADKVRVVVQLIDAKQDNHLWAESYERTYQDIFSLQSDIAKEVAQNLQKNLSRSNLTKIEETPTKSVEAYNLYLKGRFFWHRRTKEELKKSVHYFEEAIKLDSTYALAYAGLADAYFIMGWWAWYDREQDVEKARTYAKKALSLDPDLSSAYSVLGSLSMWFDRDFEQAENEFKLGLNQESNDGTAHQYYAELLNILGRKKEAREQIDFALKSNPNSSIMNSVSAIIYYNNYEFEKALEAVEKANEITGSKWYMMYALIYIKLGEDQKAMNHLITELTLLPGFKRNDSEINMVYQKYGINGIVEYYIDNRLKFDEYKNYHVLIPLCCIIGEPQRALDYLEKSYSAGDIPIIAKMHDIDLQCIRGEPEYKSMLKKLNFKG
ncbi:helix-turn-helix domain-containing protein [Gramella jeungdoensis]|uniref:Helix-turn-helix domain-containing protein n=1 Tax=Gramella jeungdoensis TaxID=708091 RepID=A0ABT0Z0Z4_9FLAO|nr:helix-turn-helix domain-containing protein [Gramella jeungdoensis]MCM8569371.1 helix-turn-helix domain-containing protein [Gramella jeungdoensis]